MERKKENKKTRQFTHLKKMKMMKSKKSAKNHSLAMIDDGRNRNKIPTMQNLLTD